MTQAISTLSIKFQVHDIAHRATPVARSVFNELDYFGITLGLERLPEEKNKEYKGRLMDVFVNRANSLYTGLINGITRELGLSKFKPLLIELKPNLSSSICPSVEFLDTKVVIYSDVFTKTVEMEVLKSRPQDEGYLLINLVAALNSSAYFTFTLLEPTRDNYRRSDLVLNQSILKEIQDETLFMGLTVQRLGHQNIDKTSIYFTDTSTYGAEVSSTSLVVKNGQYHFDYKNGVITSFSAPQSGASIKYRYIEDSWKPAASPVIIRAVNSELFGSIMFHQETLEDGTVINTLPTKLGASIINELLSVQGMYWGD